MSEENEIQLENYRNKVVEKLTRIYDDSEKTRLILKDLVENAEFRIARRRKDKTHLSVYETFEDVLYQMVKIDYNEIGAEGEVSRNANGISISHTTSRPSDEILTTIPQVLL